MRKVKWAIVLCCSFSLGLFTAACTVLKTADSELKSDLSDDAAPTPAHTTVEAQLLATAQSIEQSLGTLASAQEAESPPIINTAPLVTPEGGMGGKIDIDWAGPVGPLVDKIARLTNYRLKILGNEPAIPIVVTLTAKKAIIAEVLQNASLQTGKRAHILVFPTNRVIELRYLS